MFFDFDKREGWRGQLPNLIIIGAQKCGTTSLHYYLGLHPEIFMSKQKELNFFNEGLNWSKGERWYKSNFRSHLKVRGDTSPHYTHYPWEQKVPERMHALIPEAKLIYLIRDPIERMISKYLSFYKIYGEQRSFQEFASDLDHNKHLDISKYCMQIEQYLKFYPLSHICIVSAEELKKDRAGALRKIFKFLEVDENFYFPEYDSILNVSAEQPKRIKPVKKPRRVTRYLRSAAWGAKTIRKVMPTAVLERLYKDEEGDGVFVERPRLDDDFRNLLVNCLKDDVQCLRELTGQSFEEWSL